MNDFPIPATLGVTEFCLRQFQPDARGTNLSDAKTPEEFLRRVSALQEKWEMAPGYADFCRHLFVPNFLEKCPLGVVPLTPELLQFVRSGYKARRDSELPVLSRWVELPEDSPHRVRAPWLDLVLYSREQMIREGGESVLLADEKIEWGIVTVLSCETPEEAPMPPVTMFRNALGISEGGSGHALDREQYLRSVLYWDTHILVASQVS